MTEWAIRMRQHQLLLFVAMAVVVGLMSMLLPDRVQSRPKLPPAGDCQAMVAATAGKGIWFGQFTGRYEGPFDRIYPLAARGCFSSEYACRRWTNEILSIADGPGLISLWRLEALAWTALKPQIGFNG